jgi:hypothetical protein
VTQRALHVEPATAGSSQPQEFNARTAPSSINPAHCLHEQLAPAGHHLLRQMPTTFINTLNCDEPHPNGEPQRDSLGRGNPATREGKNLPGVEIAIL